MAKRHVNSIKRFCFTAESMLHKAGISRVMDSDVKTYFNLHFTVIEDKIKDENKILLKEC